MPKAAHDHSDNEKFRNDLKGSKSCKMSEWPLKVFQDFLTSKLNTRVGFPSPALSNFSDLAGTLDLVPQTAKSPSRLQAKCLSNFVRVFIPATQHIALAYC